MLQEGEGDAAQEVPEEGMDEVQGAGAVAPMRLVVLVLKGLELPTAYPKPS